MSYEWQAGKSAVFGWLPDAGGPEGGEEVFFCREKRMSLGNRNLQAPIEGAGQFENAATASYGMGVILRGFAGEVVVVVIGAVGGELLAVVHFQETEERHIGRFGAVLLVVPHKMFQLAQLCFERGRNQHGKSVGR